MASGNCATCRFYQPYGNGEGYCTLQDKEVKHGGSCCDREEK